MKTEMITVGRDIWHKEAPECVWNKGILMYAREEVSLGSPGIENDIFSSMASWVLGNSCVSCIVWVCCKRMDEKCEEKLLKGLMFLLQITPPQYLEESSTFKLPSGLYMPPQNKRLTVILERWVRSWSVDLTTVTRTIGIEECGVG